MASKSDKRNRGQPGSLPARARDVRRVGEHKTTAALKGDSPSWGESEEVRDEMNARLLNVRPEKKKKQKPYGKKGSNDRILYP